MRKGESYQEQVERLKWQKVQRAKLPIFSLIAVVFPHPLQIRVAHPFPTALGSVRGKYQVAGGEEDRGGL